MFAEKLSNRLEQINPVGQLEPPCQTIETTSSGGERKSKAWLKVSLPKLRNTGTCVSSRHSRKCVTLLKLMMELRLFFKLLEHLSLDHFFEEL